MERKGTNAASAPIDHASVAQTIVDSFAPKCKSLLQCHSFSSTHCCVNNSHNLCTQLLFQQLPSKTAHFKTLRDKDDDTTKQSVQAKLDAYLDQAARYRDNMIQLEREKLEEEAKKHSGYTGDKESSNLFVQRKGAEAQAKFIISNPPTADVADHLHKLIDKSSDPRGSTFSTKVHGNMSGRGNSASKQRGELTQVCPVQRHFTGCRVTRGRT